METLAINRLRLHDRNGGGLRERATERLRTIVDHLPRRKRLEPEERTERDRLVNEIHQTCKSLFARYGEIRQCDTNALYDDVALILQRAGGIKTGMTTMRYRVIQGAVVEDDGSTSEFSVMTPIQSLEEQTFVVGRTPERFTKGFLVVTPTRSEMGQLVLSRAPTPMVSVAGLAVRSRGEPRLDDVRGLHATLSAGVHSLR